MTPIALTDADLAAVMTAAQPIHIAVMLSCRRSLRNYPASAIR